MSEPHPISFRPVEAGDFPTMTAWLAEPHVRRFYQKQPITLAEVAEEYGPAVRGEEPTLCHLAIAEGRPFGYLQSYLNRSYPEWVETLGRADGISVDLYIGDPTRLRGGYGRAMLRAYVEQVCFAQWPEETRVYIAHETTNGPALACSLAAGFKPLGTFLEDGLETRLLAFDRVG